MKPISTSYGDSFNAKQLSVAGVARDFIAPAQFYQLLGLNHCVLIGPRGSGKTTLLKMLEADASRAYASNRSGDTTAEVEFIGVFVPADVRWAQQLAAQVEGISAEQTKERLYELAFGTSILLALLDTIDKCIEISRDSGGVEQDKFGLFQDRANEVTLARRLSELWATPIGVPSLSELKHRLRLRQTKFPSWALKLKSGLSMLDLAVEEPYVSLTWLDCIVTGIETINEFIGHPTQRWALLLDELEIVPPSLLRSIVGCLRSTSSNLIFKLALSPSASGAFSTQQDSDPSQGNDFKVLNLWYNARDDLRNFASRLMCQALARRGYAISEGNVASLLGRSSIYEEDPAPERGSEPVSTRELQDSAQPKDKRQALFSELAEKDDSFIEFLKKSEIDLNDLDLSDGRKQGPLIRKITPLVQFRNRAIKSWTQNKTNLRSGKVAHDPYFGYPNILDITEGNPRWVLNLVDLLDAEGKIKSLSLSAKGVQSSAITAMHQRFASMLKIYPVQTGSSGEIATLYDFLATLAESIRTRLFREPFSADPPQSFEVDSIGASEYRVFLEAAIHLGALVIMNPEAPKSSLVSPSGMELVGSRVRLCYRLAPEFFLPLRSTHSTKLSSAVNKGHSALAPEESVEPGGNASTNSISQPGLF